MASELESLDEMLRQMGFLDVVEEAPAHTEEQPLKPTEEPTMLPEPGNIPQQTEFKEGFTCKQCTWKGAWYWQLVLHIADCQATYENAPKVWQRYSGKKLAVLQCFPQPTVSTHGTAMCTICNFAYEQETELLVHFLGNHKREDITNNIAALFFKHIGQFEHMARIVKKPAPKFNNPIF